MSLGSKLIKAMKSVLKDLKNKDEEIIVKRHSGEVAKVKNAAGAKGILLLVHNDIYFRVYEENGDFEDYQLRHNDLFVTIDSDFEAAFYTPENGGQPYLDHAPETLGLDEILDNNKEPI